MREVIYAMYKGDRFIDTGTIRELSKRTGKTEKELHWYAGSRKAKERYDAAYENGNKNGGRLILTRVCRQDDLWKENTNDND